MTLAHVMGMPIEESALALAPGGAAILTGVAVVARSKLATLVEWLRRPTVCGRSLPPRDSGDDLVRLSWEETYPHMGGLARPSVPDARSGKASESAQRIPCRARTGR